MAGTYLSLPRLPRVLRHSAYSTSVFGHNTQVLENDKTERDVDICVNIAAGKTGDRLRNKENPAGVIYISA